MSVVQNMCPCHISEVFGPKLKTILQTSKYWLVKASVFTMLNPRGLNEHKFSA